MGRSFRYPGLAAILSKPFPKKLEWEAVRQDAVKAGPRRWGKFTERALKDSFTTNFIKPLTRLGNSMRSVVITGASTGIGWASAKLLLDRGFHVFGSVRKQADAARLQAELGANFTPLTFDVTDEAAVLAAAREVRNQFNGETLAGGLMPQG